MRITRAFKTSGVATRIGRKGAMQAGDTICRLTIAVLLGASMTACSLGSAGIPSSPEKVTVPEISFTIPAPERWTMDNGIEVYYYHNDELPQVRGVMYFPGGSLSDYSGITGLASAVGDQMREGATTEVAPDDLDRRLDSLAASIETDFGREYGTAGFFSLTEDFDEVFGLYADVIQRPGFDVSRLELWKKLVANSIVRRKDSPDKMAGMAFAEQIYGKGSPFARSVDADSLALITPDRMRQFHRRFVRPDGAKLAISGALSRKQIEAALEKHFGSWPEGHYVRPSLPKVDYTPQAGIYVLERDFDQATVLIGHQGPARHTPDQYDISIYNRVFGHGGFGSTLFKEIRSRLGLAYSVYGGISSGVVRGVFQMSMGTRATQAEKAIKKAIELSAETKSELPDEKSFNDAKSAVQRSFVFRFASPDYIARRAVILKLLGYAEDYDQTYLANIEKVSREDVLAVGKKRIRPEDFVVVVVGRVSAEQLANAFAGTADVYRLDFDTVPRVVGRVLPTQK